MTVPKPGEHKTVRARFLEYAAEAGGWTFVSHEEAEQRRGLNPEVHSVKFKLGNFM